MATGTSVGPALQQSGEGPAKAPGGIVPAKPGTASVSEFDEERWRPVLNLPCELAVELPLPGFKVADLLKLRAGSVIATSWHVARDVPLRINGSLIGWSEFEVVGARLAVRLTELA